MHGTAHADEELAELEVSGDDEEEENRPKRKGTKARSRRDSAAGSTSGRVSASKLPKTKPLKVVVSKEFEAWLPASYTPMWQALTDPKGSGRPRDPSVASPDVHRTVENYLTRVQVQEDQSAVEIQKAWRGHRGRMRAQAWIDGMWCLCRMQSMVRGARVRQVMRRRQKRAELVQKRERTAIAAQAITRGWIGRRRASEQRAKLQLQQAKVSSATSI